jgi:hypothetical protein
LLLIGGAIVLAIAWSSHILNVFQALDYVQTHSPSLYALITTTKTQIGLTVVAVLMCGSALMLLLRERRKGAAPQKTPKSLNEAIAQRTIPKIVDDPDVNALNLRITNDIEKTGLNDCFLYLHRRVLVSGKARTPLPSFQPMRLTSNHHNIPYLEERRYQLLEFTNPAQPFFRGYEATVDLPCMGVWRLDLELVWYGGTAYRFSKCFAWESGKSPYFSGCPSESISGTVEASTVLADDPRVYLTIVEQKFGPVKADIRTVFEASNEGGTEARNIQINLPLAVGSVTFTPVDVVAARSKVDIIPEVVGERWAGHKYSVYTALGKQPFTVEGMDVKEYPFTLTYENHNGTRKFECSAKLIYRPLHKGLRGQGLHVYDGKKIAEIKHGECKVVE